MKPDINRCDHDLRLLESDTFDVGSPSQWCPECGLILAVSTDSVNNAVTPIPVDICPVCEGDGRYAWGEQGMPLELGPNDCTNCGGTGFLPPPIPVESPEVPT